MRRRMRVSDSAHKLLQSISYISTPRHLICYRSLPVNKQINDKERIAAGMENPNLKSLVEKCIADEE